MILALPLIVAFTVRPAVYANDDRLRIRNPFRVIVLPWGQAASLRSGYSNEVVTESGDRFQLWAVPVSLRARKRAARKDARAERGGGAGLRLGFGGGGAAPPRTPALPGPRPTRSWTTCASSWRRGGRRRARRAR